MQRLALLCCAAMLAACAKSEKPVADDRAAMDTAMDTAMAAEAKASASAVSLADFAGTWKLTSMDVAGGNVVESELVATADTSGWTLTGPKRKPIPVRVLAVAGDSVVIESGPYESFIRKGVQVTTRTVNRLQGDKMVGTMEARYALKGGDSVSQRKVEGTRVH